MHETAIDGVGAALGDRRALALIVALSTVTLTMALGAYLASLSSLKAMAADEGHIMTQKSSGYLSPQIRTLMTFGAITLAELLIVASQALGHGREHLTG